MNDARVAEWEGRFLGYREHVSRADIEAWLAQFDAVDYDTAARVLDATDFVTRPVIENGFRSMVSQLPGWHRSEPQRQGRWFFMSLAASAGESGDSMLHLLRVATGLGAKHFNSVFVHKADLLKHLPDHNDSVVFVDDFAGTGEQAIDAWGRVLRELLPQGPRVFLIFAAASKAAIDRITGRLAEDVRVSVRAHRKLGKEDHFFEQECKTFSSAEKASILAYCMRAEPKRAKGQGDCGFLIVLAHQCPNNSIPILHSSGRHGVKGQPAFKGLFPRR